MPEERGTGFVAVHGSAGGYVDKGDLIIVLSEAWMPAPKAVTSGMPITLLFSQDGQCPNQVKEVLHKRVVA